MANRAAVSNTRPPRFKTEGEEADWWVSPAGREFSRVSLAGKKMVTTDKTKLDGEIRAQLKSGLTVRFTEGLDIKPTDPAKLQELINRVKAKQTQAISLRLPKGDIEAAKRIAEATGIGYQRVLKEIISKGLRQG